MDLCPSFYTQFPRLQALSWSVLHRFLVPRTFQKLRKVRHFHSNTKTLTLSLCWWCRGNSGYNIWQQEASQWPCWLLHSSHPHIHRKEHKPQVCLKQRVWCSSVMSSRSVNAVWRALEDGCGVCRMHRGLEPMPSEQVCSGVEQNLLLFAWKLYFSWKLLTKTRDSDFNIFVFFSFFKYVTHLGLTIPWYLGRLSPDAVSPVVNHCWSSLVAVPKNSIYLSVERSSLSVRTWVRQEGPAVLCVATPSVLVRAL